MGPISVRGRRLVRAGALVLVVLGLANCSKYLDAVVFNACAEPVTVSFGVRNVEDEGPSSTLIPPGRAVIVKGVIADPADKGEGYVRIEGQSESEVRLLTVQIPDDSELVPVMIGPTNCL